MIIVTSDYNERNRSYYAKADSSGNAEQITIELYTMLKMFMDTEPEMLGACISSILPEITEGLEKCSDTKLSCFVNLIDKVQVAERSNFDKDSVSNKGH